MAGTVTAYAAGLGRAPRNGPRPPSSVSFVQYQGWTTPIPGDVYAAVAEAQRLPGGCPISSAQLAIFTRGNIGFLVYCCGKGWIITPTTVSAEIQKGITDQCLKTIGAKATFPAKGGGSGLPVGGSSTVNAIYAALGAGNSLGNGIDRSGFGVDPFQRGRAADATAPKYLPRLPPIVNPTTPAREVSGGIHQPMDPRDLLSTGACSTQGQGLLGAGLAACVNNALGITQASQAALLRAPEKNGCVNGEDIIGCNGHYLNLPGGTLLRNPGYVVAFATQHGCCPGGRVQIYLTWAGSYTSSVCGRRGITSSECGGKKILWDHQPTEQEIVSWSVANCGRPKALATGKRPPTAESLRTKKASEVHARVFGAPYPGGVPLPPIGGAPTPGYAPQVPPSQAKQLASCAAVSTCGTVSFCWDHPPTEKEIVAWSNANCGRRA